MADKADDAGDAEPAGLLDSQERDSLDRDSQDRDGEEEAWAYRVFERARWGGAPPICPHCGTIGSSRYLPPQDGIGRVTRTGGRSARRVWSCTACARQFSVLTGTVLQGTRVPLTAWLRLLDVVTSARGAAPASSEIAQRCGTTRETARRMLALVDRVTAQRAGGSRPSGH